MLVDTEKQRKLELISKGGQESSRKILNWEIFVREFWLCYFQGGKKKKTPKQHKQFNFKVIMDNEEAMINRP